MAITEPAPGATVSGRLAVHGTASIQDFDYYKLEYSVDGANWTVADGLHREPVEDGELGTWDLAGLPTGDYILRLVVINTGGNFQDPCKIPISIEAAAAVPTQAQIQPTAAPTKAPSAANVVIVTCYNKSKTEHVEIANKGNAVADLSGWSVNGSKGDERYVFPAGFTLAPGATVRLHSGEGGINAPPTDIHWTEKTVWNNDGETVYLYDASGQLMSQYSY